jgi:hypothetical protein
MWSPQIGRPRNKSSGLILIHLKLKLQFDDAFTGKGFFVSAPQKQISDKD